MKDFEIRIIEIKNNLHLSFFVHALVVFRRNSL